MNWTVTWEPDIWNELHQLWAIGPDSGAILAASDSIEVLLTADPTGNGQYLSEGLWRLRVPPLVVHYTVDLINRHVEVTHCARTS